MKENCGSCKHFLPSRSKGEYDGYCKEYYKATNQSHVFEGMHIDRDNEFDCPAYKSKTTLK